MEQMVAQHTPLVIAFVGTLLAIIGFFLMRTLKAIDSNQQTLHSSQTKLSEKFDVELKVVYMRIATLEREFYTLAGEHKQVQESLKQK